MRALATPARVATLLGALSLLASLTPSAAAPAADERVPGWPVAAKPFERGMYSGEDEIEASSFLWNDQNKFAENHHPRYVADDDPATAWIEGGKSSGAGEWLRLTTWDVGRTTRVRLRVRNGYQKSKDLWKANARAKAVTVRLLPGNIEKKVTLTDTDGWQEIVVDQPSGSLQKVELAIDSVYEGTRTTDLAISDIQVFATSVERDFPGGQQGRLASLTSWKNARLAAMKLFQARQAELPLYPAYDVRQLREFFDDGVAAPERFFELAAKDPVFAKEWKDALAVATAIEKNPGSMTRAQLAPTSQTRLVEVNGLQVFGIWNFLGGAGIAPRADAIQLPMLGLVSAMFADQLRAVDAKTGPTIEQYKLAPKGCGTDAAWVARTQPKEGPSRVVAIAIGRCARMMGRGGPYLANSVEIMIYDPTGKLVLVSRDGNLVGYRWTTEGGKPMLAGGRSIFITGRIVEARRPVFASTP